MHQKHKKDGIIPARVTAVLSLSTASAITDLFADLQTFKCLLIRFCAF